MIDEMLKGNKGAKAQVIVQQFSTSIYDSNIGKLGLLGASIAADVVTVYSYAKAFVRREEAQDFPAEMVRTVAAGFIKRFDTWVSDIIFISGRLAAFQTGSPDPGSLYNEQQRRKAEKQS